MYRYFRRDPRGQRRRTGAALSPPSRSSSLCRSSRLACRCSGEGRHAKPVATARAKHRHREPVRRGRNIGTRAVAGANPDGYTLLFAINSHTYGLYAKPGYDPIKSFEPVATIAEWSHVLVVRPDFPAKTLQELIAYANANPGKVKFGYGINTPPQVLGETLKIVTGADIQSVPYRGGAQAIQDMLGGRIDMNFGSTSTLLPLISEGELRGMAFTGATRNADLQDVPTVAEAGFPQISFNPDAWAGILSPAGTPPAVVVKLNADINESLKSPELRASLAKLGYQAKSMSAQQCTPRSKSRSECSRLSSPRSSCSTRASSSASAASKWARSAPLPRRSWHRRPARRAYAC